MPTIDSIPLLLAAADAWQVVVGLIVFVLYGIGQWISAKEEAKKNPAERGRPRPPQAPEGKRLERQGPVGEMPAAGQGTQEEALRREVENFLRRAQGKPPKQEQPKLKPRKQTPSPAAQPLESARPVSSLRREGVAEHVSKHLSSKQLVEHAEHLGDEVASADERVAARLHQKFDQKLGQLERQEQSAVPKKQESNVAAEVVELLRKPGGMRQLIIAQEILRRPEW